MLLISSQVHSGAAKKRRGLFHAMDQLALTKSITKWNGRADNPAQIPERIGEALHVLSSGRRGAGHLEVPLDILQQDFELKGLTPPVKRVPSPAEIRNSTADIRRAAQLLRQSKRPLIFAGGGVIAAGGGAGSRDAVEVRQGGDGRAHQVGARRGLTAPVAAFAALAMVMVPAGLTTYTSLWP